MNDAPTAPVQRRKRKTWPKVMKFLRRVHLYSGLMLLPWVLLYGVTAFLFNHPTVATDRERRVLSAEELAGTAFEGTFDADGAARVVADALASALVADAEVEDTGELDGDRPGGGATEIPPPVEFAPRNARFTRTARLEVRGETLRQFFSFDVADPAVLYSTRGITAEEENPLDRSRFDAEGLDAFVPVEDWKTDATELAHGLGADEDAEVSVRSGPVLTFELDHDGTAYEVDYDVGRRSLSAEPLDAASGMPTRSFLLRLHLAHTYPMSGGVRLVWAWLVDAMAVSMVAWAVTGLFMWWQIKKTRRIGLVMMVASVGSAALVGYLMYADLTA
ncbi:MAG: PepSY domain-containing protein [Planctomycetota bacterium]